MKKWVQKILVIIKIQIELFKDLRDGNINPKEVLKDQINLNFKSGLDEIKNGNKQSKSRDETSVIQDVQNLSDFKGQNIDFF